MTSVEGARTLVIGIVFVLTALLLSPSRAVAPATTLERIRAAGRIRLGYRVDARPFAFKDEAGQASGYAATICQVAAGAVKLQPGPGTVSIEWVAVTMSERYDALQQGRIDVLCAGETVTLTHRVHASFSTPIFPGGIGALVRSDASERLRQLLAGREQPFRPAWRASASQVLQARAFAAVKGTMAEAWLTARMKDIDVIADISRVPAYDGGIQMLLDRKVDVLFGDRAVLLEAVKRDRAGGDLLVIDRLFTHEPVALALPRGDEEFRLLIDRALNRLYASGDINGIYAKWFGQPDDSALSFFRWHTMPE